MTYDAVFASPVGKLGIEINEEYLVGIHFVPDEVKTANPSSSLAHVVIDQLEQYFEKKLLQFTLPIKLQGTSFQNHIWKCLQDIPYGGTKRYGDIATELTTSPRVIGNACRRNPIPIIIPCHRIVASNGIGGYSGARLGKWLDIKTWLLQHECR